MSTATDDQKRPIREILADVPFPDVSPGEEAPRTPLTREAVVHLRAAAGEVSQGYRRVQALLATVERTLRKPGRSLSEQERSDLVELVRAARETAEKKMQEPVFERGRGERPHGGIPSADAGDTAASGPTTVTLDEDDLRDLNVLIAASCLAADGELGGYGGPTDRTPTPLRRVWNKILAHVAPTIEKVEEAHPLDDAELTDERGEAIHRLSREAS